MGRYRWVLAVGLASVLAACAQIPAVQPHSAALGAQSLEATESSFMLVALPDTQYYSAFWPQHFMNQTTWLANHAKTLNVKLTTHLGDIVDASVMPYQWERAERAIRVLEQAQVPYSILAGNHDILVNMANDRSRVPGGEAYLRHFTPQRAAKNSTFGGRDPTGWNEYHTFKAAGQEFLVLALDWRASAQTLEWAKGVMREHPHAPTILTTHDLVGYRRGTLGLTRNGEYLWNNLIADSDQIFLTLNGHDFNHEVRGARLSRQNKVGHQVDLMLIDYQNGAQGGQGYMRAIEFDLARNRMEMLTFSPSLSGSAAEFTADHSRFALEIDFKKRFAAFAPDFPVLEKPRPVTLAQQLRQTLR